MACDRKSCWYIYLICALRVTIMRYMKRGTFLCKAETCLLKDRQEKKNLFFVFCFCFLPEHGNHEPLQMRRPGNMFSHSLLTIHSLHPGITCVSFSRLRMPWVIEGSIKILWSPDEATKKGWLHFGHCTSSSKVNHASHFIALKRQTCTSMYTALQKKV